MQAWHSSPYSAQPSSSVVSRSAVAPFAVAMGVHFLRVKGHVLKGGALVNIKHDEDGVGMGVNRSQVVEAVSIAACSVPKST